MLVQTVLADERFAADLAHVVANVLVPIQMVQQVGAIGERFAALVAFERSQLHVGAFVLREETGATKPFRADATSENGQNSSIR